MIEVLLAVIVQILLGLNLSYDLWKAAERIFKLFIGRKAHYIFMTGDR